MQRLKQELAKITVNFSYPNIAVIGRTGSGKTSLVNAVFGNDLDPTASGTPVSSAFIKYPEPIGEKVLLFIYESVGYESGKEENFIADVSTFIDDRTRQGIDGQIHLVWYVIQSDLRIFEHCEREIISRLRAEKIPVIIVLSQADLATAAEIATLEETIKNYESQSQIVKVAVNPITGTPFGIKELMDKTITNCL